MTGPSKPAFGKLGSVDYVESPCPLCGEHRGVYRFDRVLREFRLRVFHCPSCDVLYPNPRISASSLAAMYASEDFFQGGQDSINYANFIRDEPYLRTTARRRLASIRPHVACGRMLEVASAAGFFLVEAKLAGYDVSGVEFSAPMARYASERWGVPVLPQSIETTDLEAAAYDVIASWGVMTIIQDPRALARKFHAALRPGGLWALNTYDHESWFARLCGARWYILAPNFSQIFSRASLMRLAEEAGFELVSVRHDRPSTSIQKLVEVVSTHTLGIRGLSALSRRLGAQQIVVPLPLPDVLEYVWRKA